MIILVSCTPKSGIEQGAVVCLGSGSVITGLSN
jgi:hypothetical protein